ncbi:Transcriptional regulatory protein, C terminal [Parasphingorhabdus marina DSM 22363]|uniref:Transcriptional regulatory protein, C terminal n=1 Tax=Parasphingorhabdus marina DSM 22363 TaxID=1123272 RepID=A0A1N6CXG1_9SPHN|nr:winged helix-turn-helix domain-containing protein [Parasphingorhabdus marina]SIN63187.1 Transcriptional regulatory protein, C terminal [Parasphingorhabdus marina DSM 22363]
MTLRREKSASVRLDAGKRAIWRDGRQHRLQFKTWQVLCHLLDARLSTVSRAELIRQIWNGQDFTGEKGLNQSLWAIRHALGDDARAPAYVETVPRAGYRWIGPDLLRRDIAGIPKQKNGSLFRLSGSLAAGSALLLALAASQAAIHGSGANRFVADNGSGHAWFSGRDIIVERPQAVRYILTPTGNKYFGAPRFSQDGSRLAFQVINDKRCEMVVLELTSRRIDKFSDCPSSGWSLERDFGT